MILHLLLAYSDLLANRLWDKMAGKLPPQAPWVKARPGLKAKPRDSLVRGRSSLGDVILHHFWGSHDRANLWANTFTPGSQALSI